MYSAARKLIAGTLTAAALLGLVELTLRLAIPEETLLFSWERADGLLRLRQTRGWGMRPGVRMEKVDGPYKWNVRVNDEGLRSDTEFSTSKDAETYRILAVGDSWIFGYSVDQGRTTVDQLGVILAQTWGRPVEVLNSGVVGASAFDILQQWQAYGARYELDAVLIGTPHNMPAMRDQAGLRQAWYASTTAGPKSHIRLYLLLRNLLYRANPRALAVPEWSVNMHGVGSPDQLTAIADISRIVHEARALGLTVWFADFPVNAISAVLERGHQTPVDPTWRSALEPLGAILAGHQMAERSCWGFEDQAHPSEAGSYAIASALSRAFLAGETNPIRATEPRCADGPGVGPGKDGWEATPLRTRGP